MSQHHLIYTGGGSRCQRCGIQWDTGETIDELCQAEQVDLISPEDKQSITGELHVSAEMRAEVGNAFETQHGGSHYLGLVIQPATFAMINGLDFCSASAVKYLTRWRSKNGREDLLKALHFVQLREATFIEHSVPRPLIIVRMGMVNYCDVNGISEDTTEALKRLELYYTNRVPAEVVTAAISRIIDSL